MRLVTRTADIRAFGRMCRESLLELNVQSCDVVELDPNSEPCDADIDIRDFRLAGLNPGEGGTGLPAVIYLVNRDDIDLFLSEATCGAWAILMPVSARVLTATLRHAIETAKSENQAGSSAVRMSPRRSGARAYLDLQIHEQDRTRFLARAAHDMKTPLSAIGGYCDLLLNGDAGKLARRQRDAIATMQKSVERLNRMAQDLFRLSVHAGVDNTPPMQAGDISAAIADSARDLASMITVRGVHVANLVERCTEPVVFDRTGVERVILNLVENACRFTPPSGSIKIKGYPFFWERRHRRSLVLNNRDNRRYDSRSPNSYRVDVHNTGPDIPPQHLPHIFEEYTSFGQSSDHHSAGLGLAICRLILTQHRGHIWAENEDNGPVFSFVIPYERHAAHMACRRPEHQILAAG
jgi:signal transduction histidine kinase